MEAQQKKYHKLNSAVHRWDEDDSTDPQEQSMKPVYNIMLLTVLERNYQIYKSSKCQKNNIIHYSNNFTIDFDNMIVIKDDRHKQIKIERNKSNKIEIDYDQMNQFFILKQIMLHDKSTEHANFVYTYMNWFINNNKKFPSINDILNGLNKTSEWYKESQFHHRIFQDLQKYFDKAVNVPNKNEELTISQIQDPDSNYVAIVAFLIAINQNCLYDQVFKISDYQLQQKKMKAEMDLYSEQIGAIQFCMRFGLYEAQKKKQNQLPKKFSLWHFRFDKCIQWLRDLKSNLDEGYKTLIAQDTIYFQQQPANVDYDALKYTQKKDAKLVLIQLNIEDRDDFDHFVFDQQQYSPYHNDQRVLVGHQNRFTFIELSIILKENGLQILFVILKQVPRDQYFSSFDDELQNEAKLFKYQMNKSLYRK